ncbi:MSP domain protein [Ancylostoma caninum]|uniref:Major sperm protein n=1 Tax=Ancylostoma caninum TaxID=29170 RepID=A0A368FCW9_ANCCA|nr:MSP domain protein [Ancylostoma caninum]
MVNPYCRGKETALALSTRRGRGRGQNCRFDYNFKLIHSSPRDVLTLHRVENLAEFLEVVAIRNTSTESVMFKIKTTSPEKFRVRPSMGVIPAGSTEVIRVYLQSGESSMTQRLAQTDKLPKIMHRLGV